MGMDCTFMGQISQIKLAAKGSPVCIPPSCVSDWESRKGQLTDVEKETVEKEIENIWSEALAAGGIDSGDGECKMNDYSVVGSSVGDGEGPTTTNSPTNAPQAPAPTNAAVGPSAGEPTATSAGAKEGLGLVAGSSAGKASGMLAIAATATSAAAALFFF